MNVRDERTLLSHLTRGHLNAILDPGPLTVHTILNEENELHGEFADRYRLIVHPDPDPVTLRYNTRNRFGLGRADAASVIRRVGPGTIAGELSLPSLAITWLDDDFTQANIGRVFRFFGTESEYRLLIAYNQDQFPRFLGRNITTVTDSNLRVDMEQRRVFSRDIFLYLDYIPTMLPGEVPPRGPNELLRIERDRYILMDRDIDGIRTNSLGWWIDFRHVQKGRAGGSADVSR